MPLINTPMKRIFDLQYILSGSTRHSTKGYVLGSK